MASNPVTVREAEAAFHAKVNTAYVQAGNSFARTADLRTELIAAAKSWVAAAQAEAIEEAARVCEGHEQVARDNGVGPADQFKCADACRALARKGVEP